MLKLRTTPAPQLAKATLCLGFALVSIAIVAMLDSIRNWPPKEADMAASAMLTFWGIVIAEVSRRSIRYGASHLAIDTARGEVTFVEDHRYRGTTALVELGELSITDDKLTAANAPERVLFRSPRLVEVEQRRGKLERIIGEAQIRQLLSLDAPDDGGAYRDDPALAYRARQLIPNLARLREVLEALGDDPRVAAIRTAIDSSPQRDHNV